MARPLAHALPVQTVQSCVPKHGVGGIMTAGVAAGMGGAGVSPVPPAHVVAMMDSFMDEIYATNVASVVAVKHGLQRAHHQLHHQLHHQVAWDAISEATDAVSSCLETYELKGGRRDASSLGAKLATSSAFTSSAFTGSPAASSEASEEEREERTWAELSPHMQAVHILSNLSGTS
jgi:fumarate reductase subunit D